MQDAWMVCWAEEILKYTGRNKTGIFFAAIKAIYCSPTKGTALLLNSDGSTLLRNPRRLQQPAISSGNQHRVRSSPSLLEIIRIMQQLCIKKASCTDAIQAKIYIHDDHRLVDHLTALFYEMSQ
nr:unnamed protein product [Spirometra erinaceieuropaei]